MKFAVATALLMLASAAQAVHVFYYSDTCETQITEQEILSGCYAAPSSFAAVRVDEGANFYKASGCAGAATPVTTGVCLTNINSKAGYRSASAGI